MSSARDARFAALLGAASVLIGCQSVGPLAIDAGRDRYNNIIQSTSKEQTLSNIVRVLNHEPTSFMDVSEVDATTTFSANTSGGLSGIGAIAGIHSASAGTIAGEVGNVSGGVSYSEAPVIRYTPLLGQSLVAQLVTPISVDALEYLTESNWPPSPVFDLASSYLTPDLSEFYPALNILSELYDQGSLSFVAAPSDLSKRESEGASAQTKKTSSGTLTLQVANKPEGGKDDALDVYLLPLHRHVRDPGFVEGKRTLQLWVRLLWIYSGSQPKFAPPKDAKCAQLSVSTDPVALRRWDMRLGSGEQGFDLDGIRKCLPNFIELRTMPATASKAVESGLSSGAPLLKTYSALGVLKNATERPHPRFAVVDRSRYEAIRSHDWNKDQDSLGFYTLLPEDENFGDEPPPAKGKENEAAKTEQEAIASIERAGANVFVYDPPSASQEDFVKVNQRLGFLRRYILIVQSDRPPPANAYASHFADGAWFYIDGEDQVSQKNFDLVSLFLTMMAIPSAVPPIAPTIPVGG